MSEWLICEARSVWGRRNLPKGQGPYLRVKGYTFKPICFKVVSAQLCEQVMDFPAAKGPMEFSYDEEWLAILHDTHNLLSVTQHANPLPG